MPKKPLNIGLVGCGFMGRTHSNGYKRVNDFFDLEYRPVLKAACGRNEEAARAFAEKWQYESVETDWRVLVARDDIDAVDICTPNNTHAEIAIAAAEAGKMILCEKPLSMDLVEGQTMVDAIEKAGVPNTVWYNYRGPRPSPWPSSSSTRAGSGPDLPLPGQLPPGLDDLRRAAPGRAPGLWRLDAAAAGSGVTGDLLAHCIDTALWLNGSITTVTAMTETFIKERKHTSPGRSSRSRSTTPAPSSAGSRTARSASSSRPATPGATRPSTPSRSTARTPRSSGTSTTSTGSSSSTTSDDSITRGWRSIHVSDGDHPYMKSWWVPGLQIGYEHTFVHQVADFLRRPRRRPAHQPHLPRGPRHPGRLRRRARLGRAGPVAGGRAGVIPPRISRVMATSKGANAMDLREVLAELQKGLRFYRQERVDGGLRTGIALGMTALFERFEIEGEEWDPSLAWSIELRCTGPSLPSVAGEVRSWLLARAGLIEEGFRCFFGPTRGRQRPHRSVPPPIR